MRSITTFDLVLVPFPFSDLTSMKKRPCLVLKRYEVRKLGAYLIVCMVTSQMEGFAFPSDVLVREWHEAGLPRPSLARLSKLVSIEEKIVRSRLGSLAVADQRAISEGWRKLFGHL